MLLRIDFKIVCILIVFSFVLIDAKNYNNYGNRKTTPKPMTPKPTKATPKPTKPPKPMKPKPYYPTAAPPPPPTTKPSKPSKPTKPSKPSYPSYPSGGGGGGGGGGGSGTTSKPSKGMPYKFEYSANVGSPDPTGMIAQSESGDSNGVVTGMYSLRDPDGRERTVIYKADSTGFHATVETNELPPDVPNPADVTIIANGPAPSMGSSGSSSSEPSSGSQSGNYYTTEGGSTPEPEGSTEGTTQGGYY